MAGIREGGIEVQGFTEEGDRIGDREAVIHLEAMVGVFAVEHAVGAIRHAAIGGVVLDGAGKRLPVDLIDEAGIDDLDGARIALVTVGAFVIVGIGVDRVAAQVFVFVCRGGLDVAGDIEGLDHRFRIGGAGEIGGDRHGVSAAGGVADDAEAGAIEEGEGVLVMVDVVHQIVHPVGFGRVAFQTGVGGAALRAGVDDEDGGAALGVFDGVLAHRRLSAGEARKHEDRGDLIRRGGEFGLIEGEGVGDVVGGDEFLLAIGVGHLFGDAVIGDGDRVAATFANRGDEGAREDEAEGSDRDDEGGALIPLLLFGGLGGLFDDLGADFLRLVASEINEDR